MTTEPDPSAKAGVVVGVDGSESSTAALDWAADTATYRAPLTIVFARPTSKATSPRPSRRSSCWIDRRPPFVSATPTWPCEHFGIPIRRSRPCCRHRGADLLVLGSWDPGSGGRSWAPPRCRSCHGRIVPSSSSTSPCAVGEAEPLHPGQGSYSGTTRRASRCSRRPRVRPCPRDRRRRGRRCSRQGPSGREPDRGCGPRDGTARFTSGRVLGTAAGHRRGVSRRAGTVPHGRGRPAGVLVDESHGCALAVVGARGLGGFVGLLMGSVSQQVLSHADCPVAVVRPSVSE